MNEKMQTTIFFNAIFSVCAKIDFAICFHIAGDPDGKWLHPDNPAGAFLAGCDREKAEGLRKQFWAKNQSRNASIFQRPAEGSPLIFLDDVSPDDSRIISKKYSTLAALTSPGKCQCWVRTDRGLLFDERYKIQTVILKKFAGRADNGARTGKQVGRVAGFYNRKEKYSDNPPLVELIGVPFESQGLLNADELIKEFELLNPVTPPQKGAVISTNHQMFFKSSGYPKSPNSILKVNRPRTSGDDESRKEFSFALYSLRNGVDEDSVIENIRARAEARGRHKGRDALRYARRTVNAALKLL